MSSKVFAAEVLDKASDCTDMQLPCATDQAPAMFSEVIAVGYT